MNTDIVLAPSVFPSVIAGVDQSDMAEIRELHRVWSDKYDRNLRRTLYYRAHNRFNDFGISIPDRIKAKAKAVVGWPAKAVRSLADLSVWDGFAVEDEDPFGVVGLASGNRFDVNVPQAIVSAYTHGCAFLTVSLGEPGEPDVVFTPRAADWSAARWDKKRNRLRSALTITSTTDAGDVDAFTAWLAGKIIHCSKRLGVWSSVVIPTNLDRPSVVPLTYDAQLSSPLGRSRISRPVMGLTDMAFRTLVRMESNAEFYSTPGLWFLGLDPDAFKGDAEKWSALVGRINSVSKDEDGDVPKMEQLSQASMQPHSDMLRTIALMVASDTDLPVGDLGITLDQPSSAEAMAAAERKLSRNAERQNAGFSDALEEGMRIAARLRGADANDPALRAFHCLWRPVREESNGARADWYAKVAAVNPALADSPVALRRLGLSHDEIDEYASYKRRQQSSGVLEKLLNGASTADGGAVSDASDLKAKYDALGVAVRAGVDPADAAQRLGLGDVKFTGAVPVSLRMPESQAGSLEDK